MGFIKDVVFFFFFFSFELNSPDPLEVHLSLKNGFISFAVVASVYPESRYFQIL